MKVMMNNGDTSLRWASSNDHLEIVKVLLAADAEVNKNDDNGNTSLYVASIKGHLEIAKVLLVAGADVNKTYNNGNAPLHRASSISGNSK